MRFRSSQNRRAKQCGSRGSEGAPRIVCSQDEARNKGGGRLSEQLAVRYYEIQIIVIYKGVQQWLRRLEPDSGGKKGH